MFSMPGGWEWLIILIVALLIFGKRLPEVMKSLGRGIVEFKKGVKGVEEEVEDSSSKTTKKIETEKDTAKQENK
ncbi:MAG: twin-arginine translocase TatA/TatE family subunit [Planctomycetes bacterium]|uniref:Sec-independent protein translocase subunit TatA/TatB n=1 Tax=Candidatus Wunengus sp. YC65 TaxID=3367701 RepID=UPI001D2FBAD5|nr:twin-arginine translocase TatA/TatE family subunit [Planctomycetota bacterium]